MRPECKRSCHAHPHAGRNAHSRHAAKPLYTPGCSPTDRLHGCGKGRSDGWWKGLAGVLVAEGLLQYHTPSGTDMQVVRVSEAGERGRHSSGRDGCTAEQGVRAGQV